MADSLFGSFAEGVQTGQSMQLFPMEKQLTQEKVQLGAEQIQLTGLEIQKADLDIQQTRKAIQTQEQIAATIKQKLSGSNPLGGAAGSLDIATDRSNLMYSIGDAYASRGLVEQAGTIYKDASTLAKNQSELVTAVETQNANRRNTEVRLIDTALQNGPKGFQQAVMEYTNTYPEYAKDPTVQKLLNSPYNPEVLKSLRTMLMSEKDRTEESLKNAQKASAYAEAKDRLAQADLARKRIGLVEQQTDNAKKAGGQGNIPTTKEIQALTTKIEAENPGIDKNVAKDKARELAEAAKKPGQPIDVDKAYEAGKDTVLKGVSLTPAARSAVFLIDEVVDKARKSQSMLLGVTGLPGTAERWWEGVGGRIGLTGETIAGDFESQLKSLQIALPKLLNSTGYYSKLKQADIMRIARGLNVTDNPRTTISALENLRTLIAPQYAPTGAELVPGKTVVDGFTYMGGDASDKDNWDKVIEGSDSE